jgi:hypothetical protein
MNTHQKPIQLVALTTPTNGIFGKLLEQARDLGMDYIIDAYFISIYRNITHS